MMRHPAQSAGTQTYYEGVTQHSSVTTRAQMGSSARTGNTATVHSLKGPLQTNR